MTTLIGKSLAEILNRNWWVVLLRGLAGVAFGILTFVQPGITLAALILLFGAYAIADGVLAIVAAFAGRSTNDSWWMLLLAGIVGVLIGVITFTSPGVTALALLFYIGAWAIAKGAIEIATAIRLRNEIRGEWMLVLAGLISIAFGGIMFWAPGAGALAVLGLIGAYAVVFGLLLVGVAFRARSFGKKLAAA
jgi:uncharacterized membrane protein HdeD (DUF308 family)